MISVELRNAKLYALTVLSPFYSVKLKLLAWYFISALRIFRWGLNVKLGHLFVLLLSLYKNWLSIRVPTVVANMHFTIILIEILLLMLRTLIKNTVLNSIITHNLSCLLFKRIYIVGHLLLLCEALLSHT